jgi:amino acid adenylation domain-containing protein
MEHQDASLAQLFSERAREAPTAVALVCGARRVTYAELYAHARSIAAGLIAEGVRPGDFVGLSAERGVDLVAAILGVLMAGAAYCPLDPASPSARLAFQVRDAAPKIWLTEKMSWTDVEVPAGTQVRLLPDVGRSSGGPLPSVRATDAAYIIYTSGSTGLPKGVVVEHGQVARLFSATDAWFHFGAEDVWTMFHSYGFDFSVWEMWGAFLYGGTLVIVPGDVARDPDAFCRLLSRERVTVLNQTPSSFQQLSQVEAMRHADQKLSLRWVIFGGEALDPQILLPWMDRHGDSTPQLVNMYGITETTVHVTYRPILRADALSRKGSPIGIPIPDLRVYLLGADGKPVGQGNEGEIYVGGAGVARGYLNRPELTLERFLPDPFAGVPGARMYRSGDLAVADPEGALWYRGRNDDQVKIRGYRIESGEIAACLRRCPRVGDAVVIARPTADGENRLLAYVVPAAGEEHAAASELVDEVRALVVRHLPSYMHPAAYGVLPALPLNQNGKVDRWALPDPEHLPLRQAEEPSLLDETQAAVAEIWREVLEDTLPAIDADFFDLGGSSLAAVRVLLMVETRLGCVLEMSVWARHATLRDFAKQVADRRQVPAALAG